MIEPETCEGCGKKWYKGHFWDCKDAQEGKKFKAKEGSFNLPQNHSPQGRGFNAPEVHNFGVNGAHEGSFNLSEKIVILKRWKGDKTPICVAEDVKEFVRRLKKRIGKLYPEKYDVRNIDFNKIVKIIEEEMGEKLR